MYRTEIANEIYYGNILALITSLGRSSVIAADGSLHSQPQSLPSSTTDYDNHPGSMTVPRPLDIDNTSDDDSSDN